MSETNLRNLFQRKMRPFGRTALIECPDPDKIGTPDSCNVFRRPHAPRDPGVGGVTSWVEFKHEHAWPPRSKLRLKRFTPDQLSWLKGWHHDGGRSVMLLQVAGSYYLLPPWHLDEVFRGMERDRCELMSEVWSDVEFPTAGVMKWLTR